MPSARSMVQRAGRDDRRSLERARRAELHHGALAELPLDLGQRQLEGLSPVLVSLRFGLRFRLRLSLGLLPSRPSVRLRATFRVAGLWSRISLHIGVILDRARPTCQQKMSTHDMWRSHASLTPTGPRVGASVTDAVPRAPWTELRPHEMERPPRGASPNGRARRPSTRGSPSPRAGPGPEPSVTWAWNGPALARDARGRPAPLSSAA